MKMVPKHQWNILLLLSFLAPPTNKISAFTAIINYYGVSDLPDHWKDQKQKDSTKKKSWTQIQ